MKTEVTEIAQMKTSGSILFSIATMATMITNFTLPIALSVYSYIQTYTFLCKRSFGSSLSIVTFQKIIHVKLSA